MGQNKSPFFYMDVLREMYKKMSGGKEPVFKPKPSEHDFAVKTYAPRPHHPQNNNNRSRVFQGSLGKLNEPVRK